MDGFDDLLAPSRHALEDNPFADPFAKQRSSPDPWATPFAATDSHAFSHTESSSQHFDSLDSFSNNEFGANPIEFTQSDGDPINSPARTADDDDNELLGQMPSLLGFRESIEHPITAPTEIAQPDEDSDDDKPIMQTLKHHDQDVSPPVSVYIHPVSVYLYPLDLRRFLNLRKQFEMKKKFNLYL